MANTPSPIVSANPTSQPLIVTATQTLLSTATATVTKKVFSKAGKPWSKFSIVEKVAFCVCIGGLVLAWFVAVTYEWVYKPIRRRYMAKRCPESDDSTVVTVVEESDDMEEAETPDVEEAEKVVDAPAPKKVGWWDRRRKGKEANHSVEEKDIESGEASAGMTIRASGTTTSLALPVPGSQDQGEGQRKELGSGS